jgi:hypothetical protein
MASLAAWKQALPGAAFCSDRGQRISNARTGLQEESTMLRLTADIVMRGNPALAAARPS